MVTYGVELLMVTWCRRYKATFVPGFFFTAHMDFEMLVIFLTKTIVVFYFEHRTLCTIIFRLVHPGL